MKRIIGIGLVLAFATAITVFATGASSGSSGVKYWVELDDAFGLVSGGDLKIAGVRAGKIIAMKVDERTHRALVEFRIDKTGFGSLRTDVTCQARPESLIGEYFLDCQPGQSPRALEPGSTIPVQRTSSVVAPDLVNDVLRLPYRERLGIIVSSLGAAVAGNGQNLNDAIRRASPGLQETDKVLKTLADQNHVIADLVTNADTVVNDLSNNRDQVARWVVMANRASSASAQRRSDISAGWRKLPGFLEQLRPAMFQLGRVADEQTPALRTLASAAPQLKTFFDQLAPFADVSRPAFRALGKASATGREAVTAAGPTVAQLNKFASGTPELAKNLAIVLEHLDDPRYVAEKDKRSPGGQGYTGLESLLEYVYDQVLSVNIYDSSVHILKVSPFVGPCADYADVKHAKANDANGRPLKDDCAAALGPNQPGINFPDTTMADGADSARAKLNAHRHDEPMPTAPAVTAPAPAAPGATPAVPSVPKVQAPPVPKLSDLIPGAPPVLIPGPPKQVTDLAHSQQDQRDQQKLLNYLLAP
jgi:virulence factor Mce-like protein